MANLTRKQWPKGWLPNMDQINGDREGLVRMDNLMLDEDGVLSLVRGRYNYPAGFAGNIHTLYSKYMGATKYRFAALTNGWVVGGTEAQGFNFALTETGSQKVAAFGSANGHVLCCSAKEKKKFAAGGDSLDLVPALPGEVKVTARPQQSTRLDFQQFEGGGEGNAGHYSFENWDAIGSASGTGGYPLAENIIKNSDYIQFDTILNPDTTDPETMGGVWVSPLANGPNGEAVSFNTLMGGNEAGDTFKMNVRVGKTSILTSIEVIILVDPAVPVLDEQGAPTGDYTLSENNYFKHTWLNNAEGQFKSGINEWSILTCRRDEFERQGDDTAVGWNTVSGIKVMFYVTEQLKNNVISDITMWGGSQGPLYGTYKYAQVNVYNPGNGIWKSEMGVSTPAVFVFNGAVTIKPSVPHDPQVNEIWIFRRDSGLSVDAVPIDTPRRLDKWYRVLQEFNIPTSDDDEIEYVDITSDEEALQLNIWWDESLQSAHRIPDDVVGIQPDMNGRTLYLTTKELYVSDLNDPGLFNSQATLKLSGDSSETNLWIKKPALGVCYVGTSNDIYEVSGTFGISEDGYLDVYIKPLGTAHPPISHQVSSDANAVLYMSNDGLRVVGGAEDNTVTKGIDSLFTQRTRYTIPPVRLTPRGFESYPICVARDKIWLSCPLMDGNRRLFVYDMKRQYWRMQTEAYLSLFEEEDGVILGGMNALYEIDDSIHEGVDGNRENRGFFFETIFDDDALPRNRKDTFTFKIWADSWDKEVSIYAARNGNVDSWELLGTTSFNGVTQERLITVVDKIGLCKSIAIRIVGEDLPNFKLYNFTIEYDPRPEQLTYLRIPYTNLGTSSRKRFINYAFVLDTLGTDVEFTPLIDGEIAGSTSICNFARKGTHIHFFDSEQVGIDIGGILCGFFEYYGPNLEEIVSEKMPVPTTFLVIPQDDFGTPNRKRHSSYKFIINTRGGSVRFTPRLDGIDRPSMDFTTNEKQVVEYFFDRYTTLDSIQGTIAINIGGTLESLENPKEPFEFYGPIKPQHVEVLPPRLKEFRIPETNYGIAAKKRIRTMPFEINTCGFSVSFTPIVDGVRYTASMHLNGTKGTTYHYFDYDIFGTDFCGELMGDYPFEFYGLMKPEGVEVLPVPKKFDQIGPIRLDKLGKLQALRIRLIATPGTDVIPVRVINEEDLVLGNGAVGPTKVGDYLTSIVPVPNRDDIYELLLPKTVNGTIFRIEIGPTLTPFHRYDLQAKLVQSGMEATPKWVKVQ